MIETVQFPLRGELAEVILITEWVIAVLFLQLSLLVSSIGKQDKQIRRSRQQYAHFWIYMGFSLMWLNFIFGDHYDTGINRDVFLNCGYITLILGAILFIFNIERKRVFRFKYIFTLIFTANIVIFIIILFIAPETNQFMSFTFWPLFIVFFFFYIKKLKTFFKQNPVLGSFQ
ncbi:MAG: hypothetical protein JW891_03845, partial [Candidatus Lokiarchaeota archaeon]|nr:hypothetical protein [Candidatus Lokiarchaeota archaeon]